MTACSWCSLFSHSDSPELGYNKTTCSPSICMKKKYKCFWPWAIKVQICNNSKSRLGTITSSGMSEDFPLASLLRSFPTPADSVSHRENSSSCITEKYSFVLYYCHIHNKNNKYTINPVLSHTVGEWTEPGKYAFNVLLAETGREILKDI